MINGSLTVPAVVLVANGTVTVFLALPPLTLTGKASLAASLAAMSTLPTEPGLDFQPAVDSFSPVWLHRPAPPYCGASHTNDRKATGSCLQQRVYLPLAVLLRYLSASPRWRRLPPHNSGRRLARRNLGSYNLLLQAFAKTSQAARAKEKATSSAH